MASTMTLSAGDFPATPVTVDYGREIEEEITRLSEVIEGDSGLSGSYNPRWLAVQLMEGDEALLAEVGAVGSEVPRALAESLNRLRKRYGDEVDVAVADYRYGFVSSVTRSVLTRTVEHRRTLSDRIDRVVTNRILGIPIFLVMMWVVFKITTDVSGPYLDWVDGVIGGPITNQVVALLGLVGLGGTWVESLFVDGIIAGVGGVLVFVPVLVSLYVALAILEDSGYMARAAYVMDRLMNVLGLHGKSFLPMIVGFGCTVPAFYATRTMENEKDRVLTGLLVPFMSCGARLPVYVLFASIFFPYNTGAVIFTMYVLGIAVAIVVGIALNKTLFKGRQQAPFVMELPPYRLPTFRGIWFHVWKRTSAFLRKATTVIMATSVIIWLLMSIPVGGGGSFADTDMSESAFAGASRLIAPLLRPLGFGDWESSGALVTGFVAKEVVVGTMAQVYGLEDDAEDAEPTTFLQDVGEVVTSFVYATVDTVKSLFLIVGVDLFEGEEEEEPTDLMLAVKDGFERSSGGHGALAAFAFMVFTLLYTPCMVAVAAEWQELGAKWTWFSIAGQLALAWLAAFIIFQGGILFGLG